MEDGRTSRRVIAEEAVGRADKALSFGNNAELTVNLLPSWNPLHQASPTSLFTPYEKLSSSRRVFCAHKFGFYRRIESHLTLKKSWKWDSKDVLCPLVFFLGWTPVR